MTNSNRESGRIAYALIGAIISVVFYSCDDASTPQDQWPIQSGTGGVSGSTATGGWQAIAGSQTSAGSQAGFSGQMAGGSGGALPAGGSGGIVLTGGSDGAIPPNGDAGLDVMDGGTVDGGAGVGGASGTGGVSGTGGASGAGDAGGAGGSDILSGCEVTAVPDDIRASYGLDPFYQKYADASGIPVATSSQVSDEAITLACQLVKEMVSRRDDVRQALINAGMRFTLIAKSEQLSSLPEIARTFGTMYDRRARGLGSMIPTICAEENILCQLPDPWAGENICVHEYAHTMMDYGLTRTDPTFRSRIDAAYRTAQASGNFANTYAISEVPEFWAEGVQDWYNSNLESIPANGIHNWVNTRDELLEASPELYQLISELLPEDIQFTDCYAVQ